MPHEVRGAVEFAEQSPWRADRGLQLAAAIRGADAVIQVERRKYRNEAGKAHLASGLAIRVEDATARQRLRLCWYGQEVRSLANRVLVLLVLQVALLALGGVFCVGMSSLEVPTGESPSQALASTGLGLALLYAWPLFLLALLRGLRWPQLLGAVGLAALAATAGRVLTVWLAHFLAAGTTGSPLTESKLWMLADPIDWAFVFAGIVLCVRAWRLAGEARQILPQERQVVSRARKGWSRGLSAVTGVYALAFLGFVGVSRYQASVYLLQPGVDPRREHEALLALNEGVAQSSRGELDSAERSWQKALRLWEELTALPSSPPSYRASLATTLYDLGLLRRHQGRLEEAEKFYARAVALADELAGAPQLDDESRQTFALARQELADLRGDKLSRALQEKERMAVRKYEEAQVKAEKGDAAAEGMFREAITLWEEVLPHATNEQYRRSAVTRLAGAYLTLGDLQQQLGKRSQAEAALGKAIEYGEKAATLEPDRPLAGHNLEVARGMLERLRAQAFQEKIAELNAAHRFADALDLYVRSIEEQEEQVRSGKDRAAARRRLAYYEDRLAWLLAHCPDERVRDMKAAVKHARRGTELQPDVGDYWYTLATVQYRHGDWRESLASLENMKAREGGFDASAWFLVAMNRQHLQQREEARAALRKAVEWMEEQQRKAEGDAQLRIRYEMMRPSLDALRREAESLIEGKGPANQVVG